MTDTSKNPYDDILGTIVFDRDRATEGYHLHQFCISLKLADNRETFRNAQAEGVVFSLKIR